MDDEKKHIPIDECVDGALYEVNGRNMNYGIYDAENKSFHYMRYKLGTVFPFDEYHYDTGPPYGTAKPHVKLIELGHKEPTKVKDLLDYLESLRVLYRGQR